MAQTLITIDRPDIIIHPWKTIHPDISIWSGILLGILSSSTSGNIPEADG